MSSWMAVLGLALVVAFALVHARRGLSALRRGLGGSRRSDDEAALMTSLLALIDDDVDQAIRQLLDQGAEQGHNPEPLFALAIAYRKRGELDRAVTIHQSLLARPEFPVAWRDRALLELGRDYLALGWLDRAEALLEQAFSLTRHREEAGRALLRLQEMQRQWPEAEARAIQMAPRGLRDPRTRERVANYRAEQAEAFLARRALLNAQRSALAALALRADHLQGHAVLLRVAAAANDPVKLRGRVDEALGVAPRAVWLIWDSIRDPLRAAMSAVLWEAWLRAQYERTPSSMLALEQARLIARDDPAQALCFLADHAERHPGIHALRAIETLHGETGEAPAAFCSTVIRLLGQVEPGCYVCRHCGLRGSSVHWQCPHCLRWGEIDLL